MLLVRCPTSRDEIAFSIILDKNDRFETGRKFLRISQLKPNFLINGFTIADFRSDGKMPLDNAQFANIRIIGASTGKTSRRRVVGIGSRGQDAFDESLIIDVISSTDAGINDVNFEADEASRV